MTGWSSRRLEAYPVVASQVFRWSDSLCSRMVRGEGPRVAPHAMEVAAYAAAPVAGQLEIGAYVGVPLTGPTGELFGTLCAIDPAPRDYHLADAQPLFELQARLLSSLLAVELTATTEARRADLAESRARLDRLTGTLNRSGWDGLVAAEQERCRQHASPASVIVLDLDGLKTCNDEKGHAAGDEMIATAGRVLVDCTRSNDVVARTRGDEFAVLCVETPEPIAHLIASRLQERLQQAGVSASCGVAGLDARDGDLIATWGRADSGMYLDKRRRKGDRSMRRPTAA